MSYKEQLQADQKLVEDWLKNGIDHAMQLGNRG